MSIQVKHDASCTRVTVVGNADLSLANEFKDALLGALSSSSKSVEIDLTQATTLNVTCFQLIWAAKTAAEALGILVTIVQPHESGVLEYLWEAGLRFPQDVTVAPPKEAWA